MMKLSEVAWLYWNCTTSPNEMEVVIVSGDVRKQPQSVQESKRGHTGCVAARSTGMSSSSGQLERLETDVVAGSSRLARGGDAREIGGDILGNSLHAGIKQGLSNVAYGAAMGQDIGKNGWSMFAGGFQTVALSHGAKEIYKGTTGFKGIDPRPGSGVLQNKAALAQGIRLGDSENGNVGINPFSAVEGYNNIGAAVGTDWFSQNISEGGVVSIIGNLISGINAAAGLHDFGNNIPFLQGAGPSTGSFLASLYATYGSFESPF